MTNKKNGFFTFICSLIPGAGEMYMGFFKQGLSLMGLFALVIVVSSFYPLDRLIFLLPLIWFYSFFHVHHLRSLPPEEFYNIEDQFLFVPETIVSATESICKNKKIIAIILIVIGAVQLFGVGMDFLSWITPDFLSRYVWMIQDIVPRLIIAALIVYIGLRMIKGSKQKELLYENQDEEYEEGVEEDDTEQ